MAIENGYCTLAQVKTALRIDDNIDDELLELAIEAASREIDQACERIFYQVTATRVYTPRDSYVAEIDDLVTLTTLKTSTGADGEFDNTITNPRDFQLEPLNGIAGGLESPTTQIRLTRDFLYPTDRQDATVQVTGVFGWPSIPTAIKQAAVILSSRIFKRNESPLGVAGFSDIGAVRVSRLDPDVEALIMPFKKVRMA
jgi:hypothetical protein